MPCYVAASDQVSYDANAVEYVDKDSRVSQRNGSRVNYSAEKTKLNLTNCPKNHVTIKSTEGKTWREESRGLFSCL